MAVTEVNSGNFDEEVINSDVPVIVDFFADWCGPCKMMAPVLNQLDETYDGKIRVRKFNVDSDNAFASKYGISSIPCLIMFKDGKEADRAVGFKPFPELEKWIKSFI